MLALALFRLYLAAHPSPRVVALVVADGVTYAVVCAADGCDVTPAEELY